MGVNLSEHKFTDPLLKFGFRTVSQEAQKSLKDYLLLLNFQAKRNQDHGQSFIQFGFLGRDHEKSLRFCIEIFYEDYLRPTYMVKDRTLQACGSQVINMWDGGGGSGIESSPFAYVEFSTLTLLSTFFFYQRKALQTCRLNAPEIFTK